MIEKKQIECWIHDLLEKYHASYAILFGSYARGEANENSDIDLIVVGGPNFKASNIFVIGEELRNMTNKNVDIFEIREIDKNTPFYESVMKEGELIA